MRRVLLLSSALAAPVPALAGDAALTACDGMTGPTQLDCLQAKYPEIHAEVRAICDGAEQVRQCRKREFAARGIAFVPLTPSAGGSAGTGAGSPSEPSASGTGVATSPGKPTTDGTSNGPTYLTIRFVGALIGPGKNNGSNWDGPGTVDPAAVEVVAALITGGSSLGAGGFVGQSGSAALNFAAQGTSAPDVIGYTAVVGSTKPDLARVAGTPLALGTVNAYVADSYTPTFPYQVEYRNWPVFPDTRLEIQLWDMDMSESDPIGVIQINAEHLAAALAKKAIYEVPVADQTSGQVLAIKLSVTPGSASARPEMKGTRW